MVEKEKMKFVLNINKGTTINHPIAGKLEGGKAYEMPERLAIQVKNVMGIVLFDEVIENGSDSS